ncbi:MAG: hypothetical protein JST90_01905 [Bacteroidetes bacterium]|nr:hypothetical protein [Bacteroidota bacterium]
MHRTLLYLTLTVISCITISACRKAAPVDGPGLVKTMAIDGNSCVVNYLYDDQGRVTTITQCDTVEQYTYADDTITYTHAVGGSVGYTLVYHLDAEGRATAYRSTVTGGLQTDYTITYDADGHRIALADIAHADNYTTYTISGGNNVYDTVASPSGSYAIRRTFYAGTSNTLGYDNLGKKFLGSSSANLKKTETYIAGGTSYTVRYLYTLDYLNGVATRTTLTGDSVTETREYEYYSGD